MPNKYLEKIAGLNSVLSKAKKFVRTATGEEVKSLAGRQAFERAEARTKIQHVRKVQGMDDRHNSEMGKAISAMRSAQANTAIGLGVTGSAAVAYKKAKK
ncbi:hypothetical protein D3C87_280120 [compost metagenome]